MKRHQTAKYKKRQKKERANRKAKQEQMVTVSKPRTLGASPDIVDRLIKDKDLADKLGIKPISPARRAFQDV